MAAVTVHLRTKKGACMLLSVAAVAALGKSGIPLQNNSGIPLCKKAEGKAERRYRIKEAECRLAIPKRAGDTVCAYRNVSTCICIHVYDPACLRPCIKTHFARIAQDTDTTLASACPFSCCDKSGAYPLDHEGRHRSDTVLCLR